MISFPVWRNEDLTFSGDVLRYYITFNGETVYNGRAYRRPGATDTKIFVDRIIGDYLENEIDIEAVGVTQQEDAYGVFDVYSQEGTHLAQYGVLFNFADEWSGETMVLAEPVNGHLDPRMNMYWSKYNTGQTTEVVVTEDIYYFDADEYVSVPWNAGEAVVGVRTNYLYSEIQARCSAGVVETEYGSNYVFQIPVNEEESGVSYTIEWFHNDKYLGTTIIAVGAVVWEFDCDYRLAVGMDGGRYTIHYNTNIPPSRLSATLPSGWTLVSMSRGSLVIDVPVNTTGSRYYDYVRFYRDGTVLLGETITVQEWVDWFRVEPTKTIPNSGGTFSVWVDTSYALSSITIQCPSLVFVSAGTGTFNFSAGENTTPYEKNYTITYSRNNTLLGTTVVTQAETFTFKAYSIPLPDAGGRSTIPVSTNIPDVENITVVTPAGVTFISGTNTGFTFNFPANNTQGTKTYSIEFWYRGRLLDTVTLVQESVYMVGKFLTFEFLEDSVVAFDDYYFYNVDKEIWYSKDGGPWTYRPGTQHRPDSSVTLTFERGSIVKIYGTVEGSYNGGVGEIFIGPQGTVTGAKAKVYGNILSYSDGLTFSGRTQTKANGNVFGRQPITDAGDLVLPTSLVARGLGGLFHHCTMLTVPPVLDAVTIPERGYIAMFKSCSSLVTAPALPATSLGTGAYADMFIDCTSLVNAPALPATLQYSPGTGQFSSQYEGMFRGCTSLVNAPALPSTVLSPYCYAHMFMGCTSLRNAPVLPATLMRGDCYRDMFNGCVSLTEVTVYAQTLGSGSDPTVGFLTNGSATGTAYLGPNHYAWSRSAYDGIPPGWTVVEL